MLVPVLHLFLLPEHVPQAALPVLAVAVLEAPEPPQAPAAMEEVEEVVVQALPATRRLPTAVPLLPQLFPHALKLASRALLQSSLAVLTTTPASANLQLRLA